MLRSNRRGLLALSTALAATLSHPAKAQLAWPSGPVRIVVPFAAGGSSDAVGRLCAAILGARLSVPVVVENRGGGATAIGTELVARAAPDGQTWLVTSDSFAILPDLVPGITFDPLRDFEPVLLIATAPNVIATRQDSPYRDLGDVVAAARARPGGLSFASTGNGTTGHLAMMLLAARAGIRMVHVAYRSGGLALNDALAGHVELIIGSAALLAPHLATGALRPLVQLGEERLPALPQVPTAAEAGFANLLAITWWGVLAPLRTPPDIVARVRTLLAEGFRDESLTRLMTDTQQARLVLGDGEMMQRFLRMQAETWGAVIRDNHVTPD